MPDLASYMQTVIEQLEADKKRSAAHTYTYALKSIAEFYGGAGMPMPVDEVFTPGRLKEYEEWMRREGMRKRKREPKGLSLNTISTYMRNLKAVYHRMVGEKVLPYNPKLFDDVYTKVESQTKSRNTAASVLMPLRFPGTSAKLQDRVSSRYHLSDHASLHS